MQNENSNIGNTLLFNYEKIQDISSIFTSHGHAFSIAFSVKVVANSGCSLQIFAPMLSLSCWIVCYLYTFLKVGHMHKINNQEVSGQVNMVTLKFCILPKLDGLINSKI